MRCILVSVDYFGNCVMLLFFKMKCDEYCRLARTVNITFELMYVRLFLAFSPAGGKRGSVGKYEQNFALLKIIDFSFHSNSKKSVRR